MFEPVVHVHFLVVDSKGAALDASLLGKGKGGVDGGGKWGKEKREDKGKRRRKGVKRWGRVRGWESR